LAELAGIQHRNQLSVWERGDKAPNADNIVRLGRALGVSLDWLLTGEGPMRADQPMEEAEAFREVAAIVDRVRATVGR